MKIKYNKEKSGKQLGGGGPRDKQFIQKSLRDQQLIQRFKPIISAKITEAQKEGPYVIPDPSQYLSLDVAKQKIEEAVDYTKKSERERYESGLKNLNDQLKAARKKAAMAEEELINAHAEIARLKTQITTVPTVSEEAKEQLRQRDLKISELNLEISTKEKLYDRNTREIAEAKADLKEARNKLDQKEKEISKIKSNDLEEISKIRIKSAQELGERDIKITKLESTIKAKEEADNKSAELAKDLQDKLDKIYNKIADGSIRPFVGSRMDRPELEDKIFIDPIEIGKEMELDSYINIKEEDPKEESRDMQGDLAKLRKLLDM